MVQIKVNNGRQMQVGDYISKAGIYTKPGVVIEKKDDGTLVIDTDKEAINKYHRHSNTNGLSLEDKEKFNNIMDDVMKIEKNGERINQLQMSIDDVKKEPNSKKLVDSLRNEQSQLIRLSRELPRVYNFDERDLRY